MNRHSRHRAKNWTAALVIFIAGSIATAADVAGGANGISLSSVSPNTHSVRITRPNGYLSVSHGAGMQAKDAAPLADGVYRYEITEMQCGTLSREAIKAATRDNAANGRALDAEPGSCREVAVDSGAFRIVNGAVPNSALVEE